MRLLGYRKGWARGCVEMYSRVGLLDCRGHSGHDLSRGEDGVGEKRVVDQCRLVAVPSGWVTGAGGGVANDGYLETILQQVPQVRLDAHVRQHAAKDDLGDTPFAELQDQVIRLDRKSVV